MTYEPEAGAPVLVRAVDGRQRRHRPVRRSPVREALSPVQLVELLAEVGRVGRQPARQRPRPDRRERPRARPDRVGLPQGARRDRPRRADGDDEPVPRPGLPRRRVHGQRPAGARATRCRRRCARSTSASSSAPRPTSSGAGARAWRPTPRRTRSPRSSGTADAMNFLCAYVKDQGYDLRFALESKPNEPRGDIYLSDHRRDARVHRDARALGDGRREPGGRARAHGGAELHAPRRAGLVDGQAVPHRPERPDPGALRPGPAVRLGEPEGGVLPGEVPRGRRATRGAGTSTPTPTGPRTTRT